MSLSGRRVGGVWGQESKVRGRRVELLAATSSMRKTGLDSLICSDCSSAGMQAILESIIYWTQR